jgi:hypothetical protein
MPNEILLDQLAGGALAEKLNIELLNLAANVLDPNTKATATRTVTATITIKPNEQRQVGAADISVKASLAPSLGIPSMFVFDFDKDGKAAIKELVTRDPNQTIINDAGQHADATGTPLQNVVNGNFGENKLFR